MLIPYHPEVEFYYEVPKLLNQMFTYSYSSRATINGKSYLKHKTIRLKDLIEFTRDYQFVAIPVVSSLENHQCKYAVFKRVQIILGDQYTREIPETTSDDFVSVCYYEHSCTVNVTDELPKGTYLLALPAMALYAPPQCLR